MERMEEEVQRLLETEEPLLPLYDRLARNAINRGEKELTRRMYQSQRFQVSTLRLLAEGKIPDKFLYFGTITHNDVNVRETASPRSASLATIHSGTHVIVKETQGNWIAVQLPNGEAGWIFRDYVRRDI